MTRTGLLRNGGAALVLCARHGRRLGGESPLYAWQRGVLAKDKGVRCEAESEGSRRQSPDLTNRNRI